jgi:hypothetical protein
METTADTTIMTGAGRRPHPVWEEGVVLPPMPNQGQLEEIYQRIQYLAGLEIHVESSGHLGPYLRPQPDDPFELIRFQFPFRDEEGNTINDYPEICFFIEDPLVFADSRIRNEKKVILTELMYGLSNPADWNGFWGVASRGMETWAQRYDEMENIEAAVRRRWPEVPANAVAGSWLAQMAVVWLRYGQSYFMERKQQMCLEERLSRFITRDVWDPIQSIGEWGWKFLRSWATGFFDTIWFYRLKNTPNEKKMECIADMEIMMRIIKGRYLMLYSEETEYHVNPTYHEEYILTL